jgi:hypothetical protein
LISAKTNFSTERPEYRPFSDLRSVPEAGTQAVSGGNRSKITEGPVLRSFSELGFFHPFAENRFLQAGKGAENTKEKSRKCFM